MAPQMQQRAKIGREGSGSSSPCSSRQVRSVLRLIALGLTVIGVVLSALLPLIEVGAHQSPATRGGDGALLPSRPPADVPGGRATHHVLRRSGMAAGTTTAATATEGGTATRRRPPPQSSSSESPSGGSGIPHSLVFTYSHDILSTKQPVNFYANVQRTIERYRSLWDEPNAPVRFLDNDACREAVRESEPRLVPFFDGEGEGKFKADICRVADLYLNGGYYFDIDLLVVRPLRLDDTITFSSVYDFSKQHFFQAFLASMAGHPILKEALRIMLDYYEGRHTIRGKNMGTSTLKDAYDAVKESERGGARLLIEMNNVARTKDGANNAEYYADLPKQENGAGCCCDQVVHDPEERVVYFYSRFVGSGKYCRDATLEGGRGGAGAGGGGGGANAIRNSVLKISRRGTGKVKPPGGGRRL